MTPRDELIEQLLGVPLPTDKRAAMAVLIDVVLGALVALAVYLAWRAELTPSALFTAPAISLAAPL